MHKNDNDQNFISFVFTQDGSTGLFDHSVNDIYHSSYGAKTEAEEKFINPLNFENNFKNKKSIKVLDICYGIGYNTKAFLKKICQTRYKGEVEIDILEYNKNLVAMSPFVIDGYFNKLPMISLVLYQQLYAHIYENKEMLKVILENNEQKKFFTLFYRDLIKKYRYWGYSYNLSDKLNSFLHNIYYHCVSPRIKYAPKTLNCNKITIKPYFDDARKTVLELKKGYDIIFLDAFTPVKLPTLWSYEFFTELFRLSSDNCLLVTYSNSAAVRHAMLKCGFYVGKIFDKNNRASGTIASKNINLISNPLDTYDLGLLKTNAGVYFKDEGLNNSTEQILNEYHERKKKLALMSSSQYIKKYKKEHNNA